MYLSCFFCVTFNCKGRLSYALFHFSAIDSVVYSYLMQLDRDSWLVSIGKSVSDALLLIIFLATVHDHLSYVIGVQMVERKFDVVGP